MLAACAGKLGVRRGQGARWAHPLVGGSGASGWAAVGPEPGGVSSLAADAAKLLLICDDAYRL